MTEAVKYPLGQRVIYSGSYSKNPGSRGTVINIARQGQYGDEIIGIRWDDGSEGDYFVANLTPIETKTVNDTEPSGNAPLYHGMFNSSGRTILNDYIEKG